MGDLILPIVRGQWEKGGFARPAMGLFYNENCPRVLPTLCGVHCLSPPSMSACLALTFQLPAPHHCDRVASAEQVLGKSR